MLVKKSIFFPFILLLASISVYSSWESKSASQDQHGSSWVPTESEREGLVNEFLSRYKKSATQDLIDGIVELTYGYTTLQVTNLLIDIMEASKRSDVQLSICVNKLGEAIEKNDTGQIKKQKKLHLSAMYYNAKPPAVEYDWSLKASSKKDDGADDYFRASLLFTEEQRKQIEEERINKVKEILQQYNVSASQEFIEIMATGNAHFDDTTFQDSVTAVIKASKTGSLDQDRYLQRPIDDERREVIKEILLLTNMTAPDDLIEDIMELTDYYDMYTVRSLVNDIIKKSKAKSLDRNVCIEVLREAIDLFITSERVKEFKLKQLEAMIARGPAEEETNVLK